MKGYELIKEMPNMKLGTKIRRIKDGQMYKLEKVECKKERKFSRVGNKKGIERFMTYENMHKDFEVIEENKEIDIQSIKEISSEDRFYKTDNIDKLNELTRAIKQIDKELNELKSLDYLEISERELNKMF